MTNFREELFKLSSKSVCHTCINIDKKCALVWKNCGTDSKIGKAFISSCTKYNVPLDEKPQGENKAS